MYSLRKVFSSVCALRAWCTRHSATSPTHSCKRCAKSFSKKIISLWSSSTTTTVNNNSKSSSKQEAAGISDRLLEAEPTDGKARELQELFAYFDRDGDGKISGGELRGVLKSLGEETSEAEVRAMMDAVDSDGDGFIDLPDFIRLNTRICRDEDEELLAAFRMLDSEKGGFITPIGLRDLMLRLLGEQTTLHDCVLMIKPFDLDGDGLVSFHEFKRMMSGGH